MRLLKIEKRAGNSALSNNKNHKNNESYRMLLVAGCWLLVAGYWLLVAGYWLLVAGYWLLVTGYWLLVAGCRLLAETKHLAPNN